jgi:hypothetical protein
MKPLGRKGKETCFSLLLSPLVLATDLIFLLGSEVVLNVEGFADLLGRLALDHVGDSLATNIEKSLYVEIVGGLENPQQLYLTFSSGVNPQG